jgi:hypothetical protein
MEKIMQRKNLILVAILTSFPFLFVDMFFRVPHESCPTLVSGILVPCSQVLHYVVLPLCITVVMSLVGVFSLRASKRHNFATSLFALLLLWEIKGSVYWLPGYWDVAVYFPLSIGLFVASDAIVNRWQIKGWIKGLAMIIIIGVCFVGAVGFNQLMRG